MHKPRAYPAFRTVLRFLGRRSDLLPLAAILGAAGSFAEGLGIGLLIPILRIVLAQSPVDERTGFPFLDSISKSLRSVAPLQAILLLGAGMIVLIGAKALLTLAAASLSANANGTINDRLRRDLFRKILRMNYEAFVCADQSRLVNAFEVQAWRVFDAMLSLFDFVGALGGAIAIGVLLVLISWQLSLAVLGMAILIGVLISRPLTRRLNRLSDAAVNSTAKIARRVLTTLGAMRVVRAFGREAFEETRFDRISEDAARISGRIYLAQRVTPPLLEAASVPILVGAIVIARYSGVPVSALLVFLVLFVRIQPLFRSMVHDYVFLASSAGAISEISVLLEGKAAPGITDGRKKFSGLGDSNVFRDVSFAFGDDGGARPALTGISAAVGARRMTAIIGMSGAGKTSLVNLLFGFYEPTRGEILVDGVPLADFDLGDWRAHLGLAGQDASLIDGTVFENIAYGMDGAVMDAVVAAAERAAIHDFIAALPQGYDTEVGERGVKLSEGQRQRIGLARALLRDPEILVLDEATSALDGLTERVVQNTLDRFAHKKTLIVIAHRLSTVRKADRVIVLADGRIAEQGSPAELLGRGGEFSLLYGAHMEKEKDADLGLQPQEPSRTA